MFVVGNSEDMLLQDWRTAGMLARLLLSTSEGRLQAGHLFEVSEEEGRRLDAKLRKWIDASHTFSEIGSN